MKLGIALLILTVTVCTSTQARNINFKHQDRISRIDTLSWDSLQTYLSTTDLNVFYGHPVDSFLSVIPNVQMTNTITSCRTDRAGRDRACILKVRYYAIMTVEIYVKDFTHMNPSRSSGLWNVSQFKQENIFMIRVYRNNDCVNGSCD